MILGYQDEEIKFLLYPNNFELTRGKWQLFGGFIDENDSTDEATDQILKRTTGPEQIFLEQVASFSEPNREPGVWVLSLVCMH